MYRLNIRYCVCGVANNLRTSKSKRSLQKYCRKRNQKKKKSLSSVKIARTKSHQLSLQLQFMDSTHIFLKIPRGSHSISAAFPEHGDASSMAYRRTISPGLRDSAGVLRCVHIVSPILAGIISPMGQAFTG